jgi:putative membrane protein
MEIVAIIFIGLVALLHAYFWILEMFLWETVGKRTFKGSMPDDMFAATKTLAANQGLYNAFLSMGLFWSFTISDPVWKWNVALFFLGCVVIAGVYGAFSVSRKIFFVQALPAILGILAVIGAR